MFVHRVASLGTYASRLADPFTPVAERSVAFLASALFARSDDIGPGIEPGQYMCVGDGDDLKKAGMVEATLVMASAIYWLIPVVAIGTFGEYVDFGVVGALGELFAIIIFGLIALAHTGLLKEPPVTLDVVEGEQ